MVDEDYPGRILLAEANQWPKDVVEYFGTEQEPECHMAFHFPVMPRIYYAMREEKAAPIVDILRDTPDIPPGAQWGTFLRNHDELTLEMVTTEERAAMYGWYAPDPRMRANIGIRRRLASLLDNSRAEIELINALLLSLPGSPVPVLRRRDRDGRQHLARRPRRGADADAVDARPQRRASPPPTRASSTCPSSSRSSTTTPASTSRRSMATSSSLLHWTRGMLAVRRQHPVFGLGRFVPVECDNPHVLAFLRVLRATARSPASRPRPCSASTTSPHVPQGARLDLPDYAGATLEDLFGGTGFPAVPDDGQLRDHHGLARLLLAARSTDGPADREVTGRRDGDRAALGPRAPRRLAAAAAVVRRQGRRGAGARPARGAALEPTTAGAPGGPADVDVLFVQATTPDGGSVTYQVPLTLRPQPLPRARARARRGRTTTRTAASATSTTARTTPPTCARCSACSPRRARPGPARGPRSAGPAPSARRRLGERDPGLRPAAGARRRAVEHLDHRGRRTATGRHRQGVPRARRRRQPRRRRPDRARGGRLDPGRAAGGLDRGLVAGRRAARRRRTGTWPTPASSCPAAATPGGRPPRPSPPGARSSTQARGPGRRDGRGAPHAGPRAAHPAGGPAPRSTPLADGLLARVDWAVQRRPGARAVHRRGPDRGGRRPARRARLRDLQQVHGDYHLGQVLHSARRGWILLDFEGEPLRPLSERTAPDLALRDVAGMLRSFDYAARHATVGLDPEDRARARRAGLGRRLPRGVPGRLRGRAAGDDPRRHAVLLRALELDKALYEVVYETRNRPTWLRIPLGRGPPAARRRRSTRQRAVRRATAVVRTSPAPVDGAHTVRCAVCSSSSRCGRNVASCLR